MNKLCIGILFATAIAWAGIGVVNFPYGEKTSGGIPDACRAIQLNASNVLPANGTISIGEITGRWDTFAVDPWYIEGLSTNGTVQYSRTLPWNEAQNLWSSFAGGSMSYSNGTWNIVTPIAGHGPFATNLNENVLSIEIPFVAASSTPLVLRCHRDGVRTVTHHATTNALWTLTAAGGSAVTNLPDKTFMRFPAGSEWVRYGTATGGVVNLFVED